MSALEISSSMSSEKSILSNPVADILIAAAAFFVAYLAILYNAILNFQ